MGDDVEVALVDQGYTGQDAAAQAGRHGIELLVVKHTEAKRGFVLLPRRWVVERSFGWAARFRRLAPDYERLSKTLAGLHYVAFVCLMLSKTFFHFASGFITGSRRRLISDFKRLDQIQVHPPHETHGVSAQFASRKRVDLRNSEWLRISNKHFSNQCAHLSELIP